MIRVLVVEDELPILRSTCTLIERINPEFKVLYRATNGKEALEIIENNKVEFIMLDIHMPIMNGVKVLQAMSEKKINIPSVVLSGYQDFSYVREALRYGAVDYILKPLKKDVLEETLKEVEKTIWKRNSHTLEQKEQYVDIAGVENELNYELVLFVFGAFMSNYEEGNLQLEVEYWDEFLEKYLERKLSNEHYWSIPGQYKNEKLVVFRKLGNRTEQLMKSLQEEISMQEELRKPITIVLSEKEHNHDSIYQGNQELHLLAKEVMLLGTGQLCQSNMEEEKRKNREQVNQSNKIIADVNYAEQIMPTKQNALERIENRSVIIELLKSGFWKYSELFKGNYSYAELEEELVRILENSYSKSALYEKLEKLVVSDFYKEDINTNNKSKLALQMREYMDDNYRFAINNNTLSESFGYVPAHLREIFRKQYEVSPMEYLQEIRLKKSKELLDENWEITLKEIADMVGFNDSLYFSKVFRKHMGMSPSQYRKRSKINA